MKKQEVIKKNSKKVIKIEKNKKRNKCLYK